MPSSPENVTNEMKQSELKESPESDHKAYADKLRVRLQMGSQSMTSSPEKSVMPSTPEKSVRFGKNLIP